MELSGLFKTAVLFKQGWMYFLPCVEQSGRAMVLPVVGNEALTLLLYHFKKEEMVKSYRFGFMPWVHITQGHHRPLEGEVDGVVGAFLCCRIGFKLQMDRRRVV